VRVADTLYESKLNGGGRVKGGATKKSRHTRAPELTRGNMGRARGRSTKSCHTLDTVRERGWKEKREGGLGGGEAMKSKVYLEEGPPEKRV